MWRPCRDLVAKNRCSEQTQECSTRHLAWLSGKRAGPGAHETLVFQYKKAPSLAAARFDGSSSLKRNLCLPHTQLLFVEWLRVGNGTLREEETSPQEAEVGPSRAKLWLRSRPLPDLGAPGHGSSPETHTRVPNPPRRPSMLCCHSGWVPAWLFPNGFY